MTFFSQKQEIVSPFNKVYLKYALTAVVMLSVAFYSFYFEGHYFIFSDIGSDTCNQYVPYFTDLTHRLRAGNLSIWNDNFGLGASVLTGWSFDPFTWFVVVPAAIFGDDCVKGLLIVMQTIKVLLCVFLFDKYLEHFGVGADSRYVFAFLFGFNGFLMLWGQHYFFGTACVFQILILVLVERCLSKKTWSSYGWLAIAVDCILVFSVYIGYMVLVFTFFYILIRCACVLESFSCRSYFKSLVPFALSFIVGILIAGSALIPAYISLTEGSSRLTTNVSLADRAWAAFASIRQGDNWLVLSRFMSNNLISEALTVWTLDNSNYYEYPQIGISFAFFILILQLPVYIRRSIQPKFKKALITLSALLIAFYFVSSLPSLILYAFVSVAFRSTFVLIPILTLGCAIVWDKVILAKRINIPLLITGAIITLLILAASVHYTNSHISRDIGYAMAFGAVLCSVGLFVWQKTDSGSIATICKVSVITLLLASSALDAFVTNNIRVSFVSDSPVMQSDDAATTRALAFIDERDGDIHRIEKSFSEFSSHNDSLVQSYSGVSVYNSSMLPSIQSFYQKVLPNSIYPVQNDGSCKYVNFWRDANEPEAATVLGLKYIISKDQLDYGWLYEIYSEPGCYVYQNRFAESIASEFYKTISVKDFESLEPIERNEVLDDYLVVDESADEVASGDVNAEQDSGYLSFNNQGDEFYKTDDSHVYGTANMESDGYLMLSIPNDRGWHVLVDGEEAKTFNGDYAFIAVPVSAGTHDISAYYTIPGLEYGCICTGIGLFFLLGWGLLDWRKNKQSGRKKACASGEY